MTDPLLDRIAAIQRIHFPSEDGLFCDCLAPLPDGDLDIEAFRVHLAHAILVDLRAAIAASDPVVCEGLGMTEVSIDWLVQQRWYVTDPDMIPDAEEWESKQ